MFSCPKCKQIDGVVFTTMVDVRVIHQSDDGGNVETEPLDGNHEWDDTSPARCLNCGETGTVMTFDEEGRE